LSQILYHLIMWRYACKNNHEKRLSRNEEAIVANGVRNMVHTAEKA
jgi:hypothetical protein